MKGSSLAKCVCLFDTSLFVVVVVVVAGGLVYNHIHQ